MKVYILFEGFYGREYETSEKVGDLTLNIDQGFTFLETEGLIWSSVSLTVFCLCL